MNNKKTFNLITRRLTMSNTQLQTFVDATILDASQMTSDQLVCSFQAHGVCDYKDFINFDRDSLIDLYVADRCYDMFHSVYAKMLNTL